MTMHKMEHEDNVTSMVQAIEARSDMAQEKLICDNIEGSSIIQLIISCFYFMH